MINDRFQGHEGQAMNNDIAYAYELLGVTPDVSDKEMRSAWRKLVRSYHPDLARTDPEEASCRMGEINAAYDAVAHHRLQKGKKPAAKARRQARPQNPRPTRRTTHAKAGKHHSQRAEKTQRDSRRKNVATPSPNAAPTAVPRNNAWSTPPAPCLKTPAATSTLQPVNRFFRPADNWPRPIS